MKEGSPDNGKYVELFKRKSFQELRDLELAAQAEMMEKVRVALSHIVRDCELGEVEHLLLPQSFQVDEDGLVYCVCAWAKGVDADKMAHARKVLAGVGVMLLGPQGRGFGVETVAIPLEFFGGIAGRGLSWLYSRRRAGVEGLADAIEGVADEARGFANEVAAGVARLIPDEISRGAASSRLFEARQGRPMVPQTGPGDGEPSEGDFRPEEEPPDDF